MSKPKLLSRMSWCGPPPLLEGEDPQAYDELLADVSAVIQPSDIFEEIWVRDVVDLTWEIRRLRRVKTNLLAVALPDALEDVLSRFIGKPKERDTGRDLGIRFPGDPIPKQAERELAQKWEKRDPTAVKRVEGILKSANLAMEHVMARAFRSELENIERIDRMIMAEEARRNAAYRELERHRAGIANALRTSIQSVEDAKIQTIEDKPRKIGAGKNAA